MTNEEAIMEIKDMVDYWREKYPEAKDEIEALDMAIEALKAQQWIPCSERLPKDDGEYLVWMQWDFEEEPSYSIVNYDATAEAFGEWHEYFDPDTLGSLGSDFRSFERVFAWMPLPDPFQHIQHVGNTLDTLKNEGYADQSGLASAT